MSSFPLDAISLLLPNPNTDLVDPNLVLASCMDEYLRKIQDDSLKLQLAGKEVYEAYSLCCLNYLRRCVDYAAESTSDVIFSVVREQHMRKCVEFVICLGLYPLLDPGVSIPLEMRLSSAECYRCPKRATDPDRNEKLWLIAEHLSDLRHSPSDQLRRLISPTLFLGDLIAALLQLAHGCTSRDNQPSCCLKAKGALWELMCDLPGHVAMKELLILQGGLHNRPKVKGAVTLPVAPVWLRKSCGRLLSRLLMRTRPGPDNKPTSTGVKDLLLAAASIAPGIVSLPSPTGAINSLDPRLQPALAHALARILTSTPAQPAVSSESNAHTTAVRYHSDIARQIHELINAKSDSSPPSSSSSDSLVQFGRFLGFTTVHELCSRDPDLGKQLYLQPLLATLYRMSSDANSPESLDDLQLASASQLHQVLQNIATLLDHPSPSSTVVSELVDYSRPVFALLVQLCHDESNLQLEADHTTRNESFVSLKESLLHILTRLLGCLSDTQPSSLAVLRSWLELPQSSIQPSTRITLHGCRRALSFTLRPLVTEATAADIDSPMPYICVVKSLDSESQNMWIRLTPTVAAVECLLKHMRPKTDHAEDQPPQTPDIDFITATGSAKDTQDLSSVLSVQLFVSLIEDINRQVESMVRKSADFGVQLPVTELSTTNSARSGVLSALLASTLLDTFSDRIWPQDPEQLVTLFCMTLERLNLIFTFATEEEMLTFASETLGQILGILAFYIEQLGPPSTDPARAQCRDHFARLIPIMQRLEAALSRLSFREHLELLRCIHISLATRGAVKQHDYTRTTQSAVDVEETSLRCDKDDSTSHSLSSTSHPLVEELATNSDVPETDKAIDPVLSHVFAEITDPLLPVRGHGLIELSRLIESRDPCIAGSEDKIFKILVDQLADEDSYIYLNAIRGLSAFGYMHTDRVLTHLADRFRHFCVSENSVQNSRIEFRLKLGEAIMRIVRGLGEMTPKYRTLVLHTMTVGCRDREPLVRAASLSNLCELCRLLRHAIGPVICEIFCLVETHLTYDPAPTVRQAAANLARSFFLEGRLPSWLAADVLRDLNRLLSNRVKIEKDESVLHQIEAALGELDRCALADLFPKPLDVSDLVKEIRIMRPF